jgi:2-polyprenyl-6-methoxyphenol hydroxylase-like FAD-dependent oxidoreductase
VGIHTKLEKEDSMVNSKDPDTDVLIVGAGPTGLTLACELARHGITPRIIDKAPVPTDKSRAFAIHPRTLELFDNVGIVDEVLSEGNPCNAFDMYNRGEPLAQVAFDDLESKYPFVLMLAQSDTERILNDHLSTFGIEVEREKELSGIEQRDDSVTATIKLSGGIEETLTCRYLAGCDGAHSATRHLLNLDFKGAPYPNYWLLADCNIDWKYPTFHLSIFVHPTGVSAYFPLRTDRGRLMFELENAPIDEDMSPPTIDDVRRLLEEREIDFSSVTEPNWLAYFKLHHRMVDRYGRGRVFLAGDAAHIHSPMGGQGMNTGIQDAYNLAWKMALVLEGKSPETILDSYNTERYKVGKGVVELTDTATKMATIHNPVLSAIRSKMIGVLSKIDPVQQKIIKILTQIDYHYKDSPIVEERWFESKEAPGYMPHDHDLQAGERVKDYSLQSPDGKDTVDLYNLFRGAEHELLIFTGTEPEDMELKEITAIYDLVTNDYSDLIEPHLILGSGEWTADLPTVASTWLDKDTEMHRDFGAAKASLYLIRPDGYIGFRNQPASASDLKEYLSAIFIL